MPQYKNLKIESSTAESFRSFAKSIGENQSQTLQLLLIFARTN